MSDPDRRRFLNRESYWTAIVCGALPLVAGVSFFLLWIYTRQRWLMAAGGYTMLVGPVLFAFGLVSLLFYWLRAPRNTPNEREQRARESLVALGLLLANFPAAAIIVAAFFVIFDRYVVLVKNESDRPLIQVRIVGAGSNFEAPQIESGGVRSYSWWDTSDGAIRFSAEHDGRPVAALVDEISGDMAGKSSIVVAQDGQVTVTHHRDF